MVRKQKKYGPEFKRQAIRLASELENIQEAAKKLGVPKHTLYGWIRAGEPKPASSSSSVVMTPEEELRALKKENEELKKANFILRQAAAFFSQDHLK
jgi:transposase